MVTAYGDIHEKRYGVGEGVLEPTIIIPGKLVRVPDGTYYDYDNYMDYYSGKTTASDLVPILPSEAQRMIAEHQAVAQPEPIYDPIGETTIGGYVYLQYKDRNTGEIYTDPDPVRQAEAGGVGAGDKFVGVESRGGYDFPVYEKPDGTRYTAPDAYGRTAETAADTGAMSEWQQWQSQFLPWQAQQEYGLEQQGYGLEQQGLAQQQQNILAQMATQPASWLQYGATSGTPPVVQPWMLPTMSQEYPELAGLRAGQPIPGWPEQFTATNAQAYGGWGGYQPYGDTTPTGGEPYQPQGFEPFSYTPPPTPTPAPVIPEIPDYQAMYAEWQQQQEEARLQEEYTRLQAVSAQPTLRSLGAYGGQAPPSPSPTPTPTPTTTRTATAVHQAEEEVRKRQLRTEPTKLTGGAYIPGFQYGGWVTQPTTAKLAEKEPELVTPLSSMTGSSGWGGSSWFDRLKALSTAKPAGQEGLTPSPAPTTAPTMQPSPQTTATPQPTTYQPSAMPAQSMGQYPLGGMPELTRPSRQYQARMGPTALQQYYAYKQARTGANPEETAWRLWNMAPPGGGYSGLSYRR